MVREPLLIENQIRNIVDCRQVLPVFRFCGWILLDSRVRSYTDGRFVGSQRMAVDIRESKHFTEKSAL